MKKNLMLYLILASIGIFTIIYFVMANHISYAFSYDENTALYDSKMNYIVKCAESYAKANPSIFEEKSNVYVTVKDLVDLGFVVADDDEGNVKDPTSDVKHLNDIKIRISNKNDKITTKILKD